MTSHEGVKFVAALKKKWERKITKTKKEKNQLSKGKGQMRLESIKTKLSRKLHGMGDVRGVWK